MNFREIFGKNMTIWQFMAILKVIKKQSIMLSSDNIFFEDFIFYF